MPKAKKPTVEGARVGTKRRDMRWIVDGTVWASKFEYTIYAALKQAGHNVRKCEVQDRLSYTSPVTNGRCLACQSGNVVTDRTYTPDLYLHPVGRHDAEHRGYYIEAKGYLRAERRSLLRSFRKTGPAIDLRLIVQRDYPVTRNLTISQWAAKYLKCPVIVWNGTLPKDWT